MPDPNRNYALGRPSFWDRLFGGMPEAYAYSRHTREPVEFHDGPVNWSGDLGQHSDFPGMGGIDVDVSRGDPQQTLKHEQMHHAFPAIGSDKDVEDGYIEALMSEDPRVRGAGLSSLPDDADADLLRRIMGMR